MSIIRYQLYQRASSCFTNTWEGQGGSQAYRGEVVRW